MILWTIQPLAVYNLLQSTGVYRCDPSLAFMRDYPLQYRWLCDQMSKRISPPPGGVIYPVWAWYQWEPKRKRPDLIADGIPPFVWKRSETYGTQRPEEKNEQQ